MKLSDINIRDPFILSANNRYYLYGTRVEAEKCGFDVYVSEDLENWSEPKAVFEAANGFWGEFEFWAPEVHFYDGRYYMFATFNAKDKHRGTSILVCDTPDGIYEPHSEGAVTPHEWEALDGTLYVEDGEPYVVFCHEWMQIGDGEVCCTKLSKDLKRTVSEPKTLWKASDAPWVKAYPRENCYVTDGPYIKCIGDKLMCLWSSFGENGYCEAIAYSDDGTVGGKWKHPNEPLYKNDQGHGMIFSDFDGNLKLVFHAPNTRFNERPCIVDFKM